MLCSCTNYVTSMFPENLNEAAQIIKHTVAPPSHEVSGAIAELYQLTGIILSLCSLSLPTPCKTTQEEL